MKRGLLATILCLSPLVYFGNIYADSKPKLSLVIDDLGYSLNYAKKSFELEGDHTFAIIPDSVHAKSISKLAQQEGKEIIMHLPMQSSVHTASHESSSLSSHMDEAQLIKTTQKFLNNMPHISGINNHMGSYLTQFSYIMRPVMETIYKHNPNLYFLDSRTSAKSTAYVTALRSGLSASKRNVFLDHSSVPSEITYQFNLWLKRARQNNSAIAIAHPVKSTLSVLKPLLKKVQNDYQFVSLSKYLARDKQIEEKKIWPTYLSRLHKDAKTLKR